MVQFCHFGRGLSDDEGARAQERSMAQEIELRHFDKFISRLEGMPKDDLLGAFDKEWRRHRPFEADWRDFRGRFGETILHLICIRRNSRQVKHLKVSKVDILDHLFQQLVVQEHNLLRPTYTFEPYVGENILHMVIANSDVEAVKLVLEQFKKMPDHKELINQRASGAFFKHLISSPMEPSYTRDAFVTPLTVALLAPQDDKVALELVELLVNAGASTEYLDEHGEVHSTVMHHLAKCRWNHGVDYQGRSGPGGFISIERLSELFDLLTSGEKIRKVPLNTKDYHDNTALQLAAIVGNGEFLKCFLRKQVVVMWQWGQTIDMRFPLKGLDTGGPANDEASVLELLAAHNHKRTLSYGICVALLEEKWSLYGYKLLVARVCIMSLVVVLVTLGTAFTNSVAPWIRHICCVSALCISSAELLYIVGMFVMRYQSEWFQRLSWTPFNDKRFHGNLWQLGLANDFLVLCLVIVACVLHIWEESFLMGNHATGTWIVAATDELSSVLVFLGWFRLLRYMVLFQTTGVMVSALPFIFRQDLVPFAVVLLVFMTATAGAIRVATAHTVPRSDVILGSFARTFASLEESIHGADVNWRSTVEGKPILAVVIFLFFLWAATIVLFNILVAMFTNTFQQIRSKHWEEHNLRWCAELITQEKFIPTWLWNRLNLQSGTPLRVGKYDHDPSFAMEEGRDRLLLESERSYLLKKEQLWLSLEQQVDDESWCHPVTQWKVWS